MRIVVAHNYYQQPGGEDQVFAAEVALLRRFGHDVQTFVVHNEALDGLSRIKAMAASVWNRASYEAVRPLVRQTRAEVVHFHNTFPLISPAAYRAARDEGAAVVQTLHNFRLVCPCALLFREGVVCEECLGRSMAWPGIVHGCYRQSRTTTAAVAGMVWAHELLGTWHNDVDVYVAPTSFARSKLIEGGLPAEKLVVKPNFVDPDPGVGAGRGEYMLFVGRLSAEKGIDTLLAAWEGLPEAIPLKIVGDGPLAGVVADAAAQRTNIEWLGRRSLAEVYELMGDAAALVFPSRCYETFGRSIVEAFARGTPVIASGHGAMTDLVEHRRTGLLFAPGDAADLASQVRLLLADPQLACSMRAAARTEYESHYTGPTNYEQLINIYTRAIRSRPAAAVAQDSFPRLSNA